jgi:metal-sulfur cluster biosynthetic enzyme
VEKEEVGMSPEMIRKIDAVLEKIKDPESGLPVAQLGLIRRVRYSEKDKRFYIFTDAYRHLPHCVTCAAIAQTIIATIARDVTAEFQKEFPDLTVEFV